MRNLLAILFFLSCQACYAQVEELHVFYIDYNIRSFSAENFTSSLSTVMAENAKKKIDSCYYANWEVVAYFPAGISGKIIEKKDEMERTLSFPPSVTRSKPVDYSFDSKILRDFIYKKLEVYKKFAKISFYFYLPPHAVENYFYRYNALRNFLLDELSNKDLVANEIEIQYNLDPNQSDLPKPIRINMERKNLKQQINFFETNADYAGDNKVPQFHFFQ